MPMSDEQLSRELTALKEVVTDFRNEMRSTLNGFVRIDVYAAQQDAMKQELVATRMLLEKEINILTATVAKMEDDKKQSRGLVWGALGSAAVAIVLSLLKLK